MITFEMCMLGHPTGDNMGTGPDKAQLEAGRGLEVSQKCLDQCSLTLLDGRPKSSPDPPSFP